MKNIFIEGIQGMGKSTLLSYLSNYLKDYHTYREGDLAPIELAWCSYMTENEYNNVLEKYPDIADEIQKWTKQENSHYIVAYTRIITDYPGFHKYMEEFEIYNGRKSFDEFKEIIYGRFEKFKCLECRDNIKNVNSLNNSNNYNSFSNLDNFEKSDMLDNSNGSDIFNKSKEFSNEGNLFECAFFQNIIENLILYYQLEDDEIVEFYRELFEFVDKDTFLLLYLDSNDIEENILKIKSERVDAAGNEMWFPLMMAYLANSPYGVAHGYKEFSHLIEHFKHRQLLERRIIAEVIKENAMIVPSKAWDKEQIEV